MNTSNLRQKFCIHCHHETPGNISNIYIPEERKQLHAHPYFIRGQYNGHLSELRRKHLLEKKSPNNSSPKVPWWLEKRQLSYRIDKLFSSIFKNL